MGRLSSSCRLNRLFGYFKDTIPSAAADSFKQCFAYFTNTAKPHHLFFHFFYSIPGTFFPGTGFLCAFLFCRFSFRCFLFCIRGFALHKRGRCHLFPATLTFFLRPTRLGAALVHSGSEQKYFILPLPSVRSSNCLPQTGQGLSVGLSQEVKSHSG